MLNNDPLKVGRIYQKRENNGNPFERDCITVHDCENGFVSFSYIFDYGVSRVKNSEKNKVINMLYELTTYEYDCEKEEWVK